MAIGIEKIEQIKQLEREGILQPILERKGRELREYITLDPNHKGLLTYDELARLQTWLLDRFEYVSDNWQFNKDDFWDTTDWKRALVCDESLIRGDNGVFQGDCNHFGYAILGILYYVFGYSKSHLERVACAAETGEGHFVTWIQASDGVVYQMENRVKKPRSVRYMRDLGYEYWYYSKMTNVANWYKADKRAAEIIYNTPTNLNSDKAEFSIKKVFKIHKSKTLVKEWFQVASGALIAAKAFILTSANDIANTLEAHKSDLGVLVDEKFIGILVALLGLLGLYIRTITDKDIDHKRSIHE
jgi:hypothetical protein